MRKSLLLLSFIISLLLASCSSDPMQKGNKMMQEGQFVKALKEYNKVLQKNPSDMAAKEKIALATVKIGQKIYNRRKVLRSFTSYYEKSLSWVPENPSEDFKKEYSNILYELAEAHLKSEPKNNREKRERFDNVVMFFEDALFYNPENVKAQEALQKFQDDNFEEMFSKGKDYYTKARKQKNDLYYLNAEYYLKKAHEFKPDNKEIGKLLSKVRKINLNKINPDLDFPMAITGNLVKDGYTVLAVYLLNNSAADSDIKASYFKLYDKEGNEYTGEISELFESPLKEGILASGKEIEGAVAFKTGGKKIPLLDKLLFESPEGGQTLKYFP